jgi:hypothetical protein
MGVQKTFLNLGVFRVYMMAGADPELGQRGG